MLGCATSHWRASNFKRGTVSCALSAYLFHQSQKGPIPDVLIQITITQGLVMGRWCGLRLLAVLNTLKLAGPQNRMSLFTLMCGHEVLQDNMLHLHKCIMLSEMVTQGQVFFFMFVEKIAFCGLLLLWCQLIALLSVNRSWQERLWCQEVLWLLLRVYEM